MADKDFFSEGIRLYNSGNYTAALPAFLSLPENCGADIVDLSYYLGLCYAKLDRSEDALMYLEQVVTSDDERKHEMVLQCRYLLAVIYCKSGRKNLADFELQKLLETDFHKSSVYASLAYLAWERGEVDDCIEYYGKALEEDKYNPTALNGMGYVLACEGRDLTQALGYCKKAVDISPDSAPCLDSLGWVYYKMGLYSEARKYLERAHKLAVTNPTIEEHLKEALRGEKGKKVLCFLRLRLVFSFVRFLRLHR